jgi:hypothetical protein
LVVYHLFRNFFLINLDRWVSKEIANNYFNYNSHMVLFSIIEIKSTSRKKYQYGTLTLGKSTILHLVLFLIGTCSYTNNKHTNTVKNIYPPSILRHCTWVPQSRLACCHHRSVGWPQAFGHHNPTVGSFACRWRLCSAWLNKNLFWEYPACCRVCSDVVTCGVLL